jgi:predicted small lipoprotein YifL
MRNRIAKWLSACLAAVVLVSFAGCGEDKGPVRKIDDKDVKTDQGKPDGAR